MSTVYFGEELYHHGIKGQKWGVRRFQNYDGTRTSAGKKREQSSSKPEKKGLTDKQKKILIGVGAAAVAGGLAYVGAKGVHKIAQSKLRKEGKEEVDLFLSMYYDHSLLATHALGAHNISKYNKHTDTARTARNMAFSIDTRNKKKSQELAGSLYKSARYLATGKL